MTRLLRMLVVATIVAWGCGGDASDEGREVGLEQSGQTVALARGEELTVRLRSLGDSGYSNWQLTTPPAASNLELTASLHENPDSGLVGDFGRDVFRFVARETGTTALAATATRSWSGETQAFQLTVEVR